MYVTSSVPSQTQVLKLLKFLECNKWLTTSQARTAAARDRSRAAWQFITVRLNNTGGCKKSWQQWSKYWKDKKSMVKKKAFQLSKRSPNDIVGSEVEMSQTDKRIYGIIQVEMASKGRTLPSVKEDSDRKGAFNIQHADDDMDSDKVQAYNHEMLEGDHNMSEYNTNTKIMEDTDQNYSPEQDPLPSTSDTRTFYDEENIEATPPQSRKNRSKMEELTERFLKIEERRVDIEYTEAKSREKLADALEQMAQCWRQQSAALVTLAESVKMVVEKVNTGYHHS